MHECICMCACTYVINLLLHFVVVILSFNQSTYSVNEDSEQVQLALVLSQPSSTDIYVFITIIDGNTTGEPTSISTGKVFNVDYNFVAGGLDYDYGQYSITIPADVASLQFIISINNDDLMEGNKYFSLFINTEALPLGVYRGHPYASLVTIIDDDSKL